MDGLQWHGAQAVVEIGPFHLEGPLIYTAPGVSGAEPSAILLGLAIESPPPKAAGLRGTFGETYPHLSFFPSYQNMSSISRYRYLEWLAGGRDANGPESFQLLYLKGLERRALGDGADAIALWGEVWRLWHESNVEHLTLRYAANQFLWYLLMQLGEGVTPQELEVLARVLVKTDPWNADGDRYLSLLVGWCAIRQAAMPLWLAYHTARVAPESKRTVVVMRAEKELRKLFALRFRQQYGKSIPLDNASKARRFMDYIPVNKSLKPYRVTWPDPTKLTSSWNKIESGLAEMYNACLAELRPLGLALGRDGVTRRSILAWEATPAEIRAGFHPAREKLEQQGGDSYRETGFFAAKVAKLCSLLEVEVTPHLTPAASRRLAASVRACGLHIEPDAQVTGRVYDSDDVAVVFSQPPEVSADPSPEFEQRYEKCAFLLKAAFWIAKCGGKSGPDAAARMKERLRVTFGWDEGEARRYKALTVLLRLNGVGPTDLRVPTRWGKEMRASAGNILMQMLGGENRRVAAGEEDALRQLWKKLALESRKLTREMDDLSSHGVIFIGGAVAGGRGEMLPVPPEELDGSSRVVQLDRGKMASLMEETRHVQAALAAAMASDEQLAEAEHEFYAVDGSGSPGTAPAAPAPPARFPGLEERFAPLLERLVQRREWALTDAGQMAREERVMLAGAVESINDWAIEALGGALLYEDGDAVMVELELLE